MEIKEIKTSLDEIIKKKATDANVFNEYKTRAEVGIEIFKEMYARFDIERKGFVMNDISKEIGLLSQCQSLQAIVSLALDFNLGFDSKSLIEGQEYSIREMMDFAIEDIIDRIVIKDEFGNIKEYVFDASPYDSNSNLASDSKYFTAEYSNIDSITWVIPSFLTVLKYHANLEKPEICKWEDILVDVIKYGIKYINEAYIDNEENDGSISIGWNFTKNCQEPSLYFSFIVGECYLDTFSTFEEVLKYAYAKRNHREYGVPIDDEICKEYEKKLAKYEEDRKKVVDDPKYAKHDSYNELVRLYKRINDIGELAEIDIENTIYGELERRCRELAFSVWNHVSDGLADDFFYNDLKTRLSENEILKSTTSDALFNTVYIVNIMLAGGLDEQMQFFKQKALISGDGKADGKTAEEWQLEYDNLFESCQLAVQKAFRTYESLKNKSKDYIVDQFLIGFNERFDTHKALVNELRKLRMKTFSLLPMLIHTYNIVSEYLIKYPQHNMKRYLEYILENRYVSTDDNKAHWIWEKDGYFSGSNCYYIVALNEFYTYHQKYERDYIEIGENNIAVKQRVRDRAIEEYEKQLRIPKKGAIALLEEENANKQATIEKQAKEISRLEAISRPVEDAIIEVIREELEKRFASLLQSTFAQAAKALTVDAVDDTADESNLYSGICSSLYEMIFAEIFANYYTIDASKGQYRFNNVDDYEKKTNDFKVDLKATIAAYITSINNYACIEGETEKKSILRDLLDGNKQ